MITEEDILQFRLETLQALSDEARMLEESIKNLENQLESAKTRLRELDGGFMGKGLIQDAIKKVADIRRFIDDKQKQPVIWRDGFAPDTTDYVVDRVTPKRIYVKRIGGVGTQQFKHNGLCLNRDIPWQIDVEHIDVKM